jgi:geranylgeranyl pyrophosphate synthase
VQDILALLHRYGSVDYARDLARRLILEARSYLEALPDTRARATFASMADYFLERES